MVRPQCLPSSAQHRAASEGGDAGEGVWGSVGTQPRALEGQQPAPSTRPWPLRKNRWRRKVRCRHQGHMGSRDTPQGSEGLLEAEAPPSGPRPCLKGPQVLPAPLVQAWRLCPVQRRGTLARAQEPPRPKLRSFLEIMARDTGWAAGGATLSQAQCPMPVILHLSTQELMQEGLGECEASLGCTARLRLP